LGATRSAISDYPTYLRKALTSAPREGGRDRGDRTVKLASRLSRCTPMGEPHCSGGAANIDRQGRPAGLVGTFRGSHKCSALRIYFWSKVLFSRAWCHIIWQALPLERGVPNLVGAIGGVGAVGGHLTWNTGALFAGLSLQPFTITSPHSVSGVAGEMP
jgi:hypothetical protein